MGQVTSCRMGWAMYSYRCFCGIESAWAALVLSAPAAVSRAAAGAGEGAGAGAGEGGTAPLSATGAPAGVCARAWPRTSRAAKGMIQAEAAMSVADHRRGHGHARAQVR